MFASNFGIVTSRKMILNPCSTHWIVPPDSLPCQKSKIKARTDNDPLPLPCTLWKLKCRRNCCWAATSFFPGLCHPLLSLPCHTGQSVYLTSRSWLQACDLYTTCMQACRRLFLRTLVPVQHTVIPSPGLRWKSRISSGIWITNSTTTTTNYSTTTVDFIQTHR